MIPPHFLHNGTESDTSDKSDSTKIVSLTIKKPEKKLLNGIVLPEAPTGLGRVTETITKSTFTETVVTRITDNKLMEPVIIEVSNFLTSFIYSFVCRIEVIKNISKQNKNEQGVISTSGTNPMYNRCFY